MTNYTFRLEQFHIDNTRARHQDTDTVAFSLKVGEQQFPPQIKAMGDVNNGDHVVGLQIGPVSIDPSTPVVLNYLIMNSGYPGSHEGDAKTILGLMSDASQAIANYVYPLGPVWPIVNQIVHAINGLIFVDCDGPVAGDVIPGPVAVGQVPANILTGAGLDTLISTNGVFRDVRPYPGTNTPDWCGSNSQYTVTWSVSSDKPKESKEGKEGKEGKESRKENKDNLKEKDHDNFGGGLGSSFEMFPSPAQDSDTFEKPLATGQAFIRAEERPDVGGRIVQPPPDHK